MTTTGHDPRLLAWLRSWPNLQRGTILPIILRFVQRDLGRAVGGSEIVLAAMAAGCRCIINHRGMVVIRRPKRIPAMPV